MGRKAIDYTGLVKGSITIIKRATEKKGKEATWVCQCSCGKELIKDSRQIKNLSPNHVCDCDRRPVTSLIGEKFGKLTVIERSENISGKVAWRCLCDCGQETNVRGDSLKSGNTSSCKKCYLKENIGDTYGRLTIIEYSHHDKNKNAHYVCRCQCGTVKTVRLGKLKDGTTQSCGCYAKEVRIEVGKRNAGENHPMYGKVGTLNPKYRHDLTEEERIRRRLRDPKMGSWSFDVKKRYNFTCDICNSKASGKLVSHHLDGYNWCEERRVDITNGVCLCVECHKRFHKEYGYGNNTEEQYKEFRKTIKGE